MGVGPRTSGRCPLTLVCVDGHSSDVEGLSSVVDGRSCTVRGTRLLLTDCGRLSPDKWLMSTDWSLEYVAGSPL